MVDKLDIYLIGGTFLLCTIGFAGMLLWMKRYPSVETLEGLASIFNTKGGIIMFLWLAWWITLYTTVAFGAWVIVKGIDPQHAVVVTILGMLVAQAFGNVNGALFKTMTGEEPRPPAGTSTTVQQTTTATVATPIVPTPTVPVTPIPAQQPQPSE